MKKKACTSNNRPVAGSHVAQRRGYNRRFPIRSLFVMLVLSSAAHAFAATDIPSPYAFDRYAPLLKRADVFRPSSGPDISNRIDWKDLYVANLAETPAGTVITFRSATDPNSSMTSTFKSEKVTETPIGTVITFRSTTDPNFSVTLTFKSKKLTPPPIWKIPDASL
jgi:hypothetical protein